MLDDAVAGGGETGGEHIDSVGATEREDHVDSAGLRSARTTTASERLDQLEANPANVEQDRARSVSPLVHGRGVRAELLRVEGTKLLQLPSPQHQAVDPGYRGMNRIHGHWLGAERIRLRGPRRVTERP